MTDVRLFLIIHAKEQEINNQLYIEHFMQERNDYICSGLPIPPVLIEKIYTLSDIIL